MGRHVPSQTGSETLAYTIELDAALTRIDVQVCPRGFRIERLNAPGPGARELLEAGRVITPVGDLPCAEEGVDLPRLEVDECLRYRVLVPEQSPDASGLRRVGGDLLASPDLWLWIPTPRPLGLSLTAHFSLPEGVTPVVPWPGKGADFTLPESAFTWKSSGAFSHLPSVSLEVAGGKLAVSVLGAGFGAHQAEVYDWLSEGARSANLLFGRFPVPQSSVIVVPSERSGPGFGMALRGGGPSVLIFLDRHARAQTLRTDWTSTHEFLHLGVPRLPPEDAWLFEGLATYYTEVTRARAGIISPRTAYQRLLDGFQRGRQDRGSLTLRDESAQMRERRSFYRVYWAGAALAFLTDVESRRAGGPNLELALQRFAQCCAGSEQDWNAERVLAQLDASLGAPRFTAQAQAWLDRRDFPAVEPTLRALGVASGRGGEAVFGRGSAAPIRDQIMAATTASPAEAHGKPQGAK